MKTKTELIVALQDLQKKTKRNPSYKPSHDEFATMLEAAQLIDKEDGRPFLVPLVEVHRPR